MSQVTRWAIAVSAIAGLGCVAVGNLAVSATNHGVAVRVIKALSEDEAQEAAQGLAYELYPKDEGYESHVWVVSRVDVA